MTDVASKGLRAAAADASLHRPGWLPAAVLAACASSAWAVPSGTPISLHNGDNLALIAGLSWPVSGSFTLVVCVLLTLVFGVGFWGWLQIRKVHRQTAIMTERVESEAELGRRNTQLEQRRSRILEDINGSQSLDEIIEQITEMVSIDLGGALCWCALANGARPGKFPTDGRGLRIVRHEIPARTGAALGTLFAAFRSPEEPGGAEAEYQALGAGAQLATLAIETRRLSLDLAHRSEFDLLTDVYNRLSLERFLDKEIATAHERESIFGLIYVDMDEFKQLNDTYGNRIGDHYLREVSQRMKRQLRSGDTLARLGGDEFAALVPVVRSRADAEEIALRLERCFDAPFSVEGYVLRGAASVGIAIYPENGLTGDKLLSAADAAMCAVKLAKRRAVENLSGLHLRAGLLPRD